MWKRRPIKVLYFGLDAAGKTTLLYRLKLGELVATIPTMGFNVEDVDHKGHALQIWDIGTRDKSRVLIRHYLNSMDGVVFVVDSNDRERFNEAVEDFFMYVIQHEAMVQVPVVVLANKQDLKEAMTAEEVKTAVIKRAGKMKNDIAVFPTVGTTLDGVDAALDWLTSKISVKLGKEDLDWYRSTVYSAAHYPAEFIKKSVHSIAGLFTAKD